MNDFTDLVKKLNAISNNEETVDATGDTVYKPVEEAVAGTCETANILKVFNELEEAAKPDFESVQEGTEMGQIGDVHIKQFGMGKGQVGIQLTSDEGQGYVQLNKEDAAKLAARLARWAGSSEIAQPGEYESVQIAEEVVDDDVATQIRQRYSEFMKSETAQGNDLDTINVAVKEATSSAMAIDDSFDKMFDMMGRLMKVTAEGAVLTKMVEREGGDSSWIADAHQKLIEAMEAIEQAHMYSNPKEED